VPFLTEVPRKTELVRCSSGGIGGDASGRLLNREGLARQGSLGDQEVPASEHDAVGWHQVAGRQLDDVAGHDTPGIDQAPGTTAHCRELERQVIAQPRHGGRGAILLHEAEEAAACHDQKDDGGVSPLAQQEGDTGAEDQDEHQRALELPQQQPGGACHLGGSNRVLAIPRQTGIGLFLGKSRAGGAQRDQKLIRVPGPVGLGKMPVAHSLLPCSHDASA
jgi:hypothetical protein